MGRVRKRLGYFTTGHELSSAFRAFEKFFFTKGTQRGYAATKKEKAELTEEHTKDTKKNFSRKGAKGAKDKRIILCELGVLARG
jgi:hypothetical protein